MNTIISLISLAVLFGSMFSGFAIIRLTGMRLTPHFIVLILAFIFTLISMVMSNIIVFYISIVLQILTPITICGTICNILKTQFQNSGIYSAHLGFMGMILILAIGNFLIN